MPVSAWSVTTVDTEDSFGEEEERESDGSDSTVGSEGYESPGTPMSVLRFCEKGEEFEFGMRDCAVESESETEGYEEGMALPEGVAIAV